MDPFPHKAVPEIILQRYVTDKYKQFESYFEKHYGSGIKDVRPNPVKEDNFPDLYFRLKDGRDIPVEVEWKTSKFDHATIKNTNKPNPEFENFVRKKGLVFVVVEEKNSSLGSIKQVRIPLDRFERWFVSKSKTIVRDATEEFRKQLEGKQHRLPKTWFTLLTKKGNALKHFGPALENETWGIQEKYHVSGEGRLEDIQEGDLIAFLAGLHGYFISIPKVVQIAGGGWEVVDRYTNKILKKGKRGVHRYTSKKKAEKAVKDNTTQVAGRYPLPVWIKKSFNGYFDYVCVFRVTEGYKYDRTKIAGWKTGSKSKWKNERFPHRFKFDKNPILIMEKSKVRPLALTTKKELHSIVYSNIGKCEPYTFVDILHNTKQVRVNDYEKVLEEIPRL